MRPSPLKKQGRVAGFPDRLAEAVVVYALARRGGHGGACSSLGA